MGFHWLTPEKNTPRLQYMKIGYGYERAEALFDSLGCERVYLDTPGTYRTERAAMFKPAALRLGDTLILLALGDLGRGFGLTKFQQMLEDRGISIEVYPVEKIEGLRGRPRKFDPDGNQDDLIRTLWRTPAYTLAYVLKRAGEIMGHDVARHQLSHRYKRRNGKR